MSNITLCLNTNWIDDQCTLSSTVSVGGAAVAFVSTLPLSNLKTRIYDQVARTSSATTLVLTATWPTAHTFSSVSLINHNLSPTATVRFQLYTDATRAVLVWDSTTINAWAYDEHYWMAYLGHIQAMTTYFALTDTQVGKVLDITITDASNANGYIEIGRLYATDWFQPAIQPEYSDVSFNWVDPSENQIVPESGTRYFRKLKKWRTASINWKDLTSAEVWHEWDTLNFGRVKQGVTGEMLFAYTRDRDESGAFYQTFMCQLEAYDPLTQPYSVHYQCTLNLREIL